LVNGLGVFPVAVLPSPNIEIFGELGLYSLAIEQLLLI